MAVNDIYQIRLNGTYGPGQWSNVWYYQMVAGASSGDIAQDLWEQFNAVVLPFLAPLQSTTIVYTSLEVVNMRNTLDYQTGLGITDGGSVSGEALAPTVAFQYRQARPAPGFRYGYKRFIGAPESHALGALWSPPAEAAYALASAMEASLEGSLGAFEHVIVGSPRVFGANPPVRYLAKDWTPRQYLSSQVTRQIYNPNPLPPPTP